ncbi:MAG: sulfite exporter TauE/SafE family protein [Acidobacteriota bacterium]
MNELWFYPILFLTGIAAGTLNVIAGGGSFLTIPLLIFMGLPPLVANGTNRIGILLQNVAATWSFKRHGILKNLPILPCLLSGSAGAVLGVPAAIMAGDNMFKKILAILMILISLWTIIDPLKRIEEKTRGKEFNRTAAVIGFFFCGFLSGFVQAGVGFFILALTTYLGLDMVRGNALKVTVILGAMIVSLSLYAWQGLVLPVPGLVLAGGTILGSQIGVKLTILKGHKWVKGVVTVMVIIFAIKLLFDS